MTMCTPLVLLVVLSAGISLRAESVTAPAVPTWWSNPDCQLVYFAVIEGCYRSGLQNEAVDAIITPPTPDQPGVKTCFVFQCDLCHAAYEGFVTYRRRQSFLGGSADTFGPGVSAEVIAALKDPTPSTRVITMGKLMRPWIRERVRSMNLSADDLRLMAERFLVHINKGKQLLTEYRKEPGSVYEEWNFYGYCQACEASEEIRELIPSGN